MKSTLALFIAIPVLALFFTSCSPFRTPGLGLVYTSASSNISCHWVVDEEGNYGCVSKDGKPVGKKTGSACAYSVLSLVTWGDMSLKAAATNGGLEKVQSIDLKQRSVLWFVFEERCLLVNGE